MQYHLSTPEALSQRLNTLLNKFDPELARELHKQQVQFTIQRKLRWQDRYLLILFGVILSLLLISSNVQAEEIWGLQFTQDEQTTTSISLNTTIEIEVIGAQARVEVWQEFVNSSDSWAEASYRYPLPDGAAVDQLSIEVGGRLLVGEIQEKQQAEKNYQQASENGQTASLIKQERANQFVTQLANIGPGESIKVKIGFLQDIRYANDQFRLRLPMTFTPRHGSSHQNTENIQPVMTSSATDHRLMLSVNLITSFELAELNSSYHAINIHETMNGYFIILEDQLESWQPARTDKDFELVWSLQAQDQPVASILTWEDDDGFYAQLQLIPPKAAMLDERLREVIFVIDNSGSMAGESMRQAKQALREGLTYLRPGDRFNVINFESNASALFAQPTEATQHSTTHAEGFITALEAAGGTNILPALELSLLNPVMDQHLRQIVFITDGAVGNENEIYAYLIDRIDDARIFTIAIGAAPNNWFMRKLAQSGRGSYTNIGKMEEIQEKMSNLWQRISLPALSDICIDWGQAAEMYPPIIPDLYAGDSLMLTAKLASRSDEVTLCGHFNGEGWQYTQPLPQKTASADIARNWARRKIETIDDNQLLGLPYAEARAQILETALKYGLLSRFTALVAIDPEPARAATEELQKQSVASLLPSNTVSMSLAQGSLGWQWQLLLGLISLLLSGGMYWASIRK